MTTTHYTVWMTSDPHCLDQGCMDVTILEDQLIGGEPEDEGAWATDSSKESPFHAVTTVDAREGDWVDAVDEAEDLLRDAGWRVTSSWDSTDHAHTATVERV